MKKYLAKKTSLPMNIQDERWEKAQTVILDSVWENACPSPYKTVASMVHGDDGFSFKISTDEWPLRVTATEHNGSICVDSCMEFFFTPNTADKDYINFEMNPVGATLTCIGEGRHNRRRIDIHGEGIVIETLIRPECGWEVMLFVPKSFLNKYFSSVDSTFRANFYKCGDKTVIPHYSTWNPVFTEKPDYHQPSLFGEIILSEEEL